MKTLISSALPYVNGPLHIGHLVGCYLPSDVYARFCRATGRDVLYVCGADEHGTPVVLGAQKAGMTTEDYANKWYEKQKKAVSDFNLSFDLYGRTHTQKHVKLVQGLFTRLDEQGLIEERISEQLFSVDDNMFLADRFIKGTCPKCGYEKADGDQCEKCGTLLEPKDLINPYSAISGGHNIELRKTKHLYFRASAMEDKLREWINSRIGWPKTALAIANKWLDEGLRDTPITRDLPWGIPVNKPGYEDKVFYVWFDAPWGYVSISQYASDDWESWWKNPDCHYAQFMGKDNVSFHAVFFPQQELAMNDNWKTVDVLKAQNFMNFEGNKISKSLGNGVFLEDAINDAPSDSWRYALLASAPETDDTDFTIQRFADIVNKDLNGMLGNFVSRVCKITEKNFGAVVPGKQGRQDSVLLESLNGRLSDLTGALERCEFRKSIDALRSLWAAGNEFFARTEPWLLVKNDKELAAEVLHECFCLIDFYARVSGPFIPDAAKNMLAVFQDNKLDLTWPKGYERRIEGGDKFTVPENLFARIDEDKIKAMTERYVKQAPKIIIAEILEVTKHPDADNLNLLKVNTGTEVLDIVCGAPNVRVGLKSVLAKVGAVLPVFDKPLAARKVRGFLSNGMMCAPDELGQTGGHDGIIEMSSDSQVGTEYKIA